MCYTGGPRCSGHVSKELAKAKEAFLNNPSDENMERVRTKDKEFLRTPEGIKILRARGDDALADHYERDRSRLLALRKEEERNLKSEILESGVKKRLSSHDTVTLYDLRIDETGAVNIEAGFDAGYTEEWAGDFEKFDFSEGFEAAYDRTEAGFEAKRAEARNAIHASLMGYPAPANIDLKDETDYSEGLTYALGMQVERHIEDAWQRGEFSGIDIDTTDPMSGLVMAHTYDGEERTAAEAREKIQEVLDRKFPRSLDIKIEVQ